jgi:hypothetical protein
MTMAIKFFSVSHRGRLTHKVSTALHAQYITREGRYTPTADHAEHLTRGERQPRTREDLVASGGNLPEWAHGNHATFWNAAEKHERANGRFCEDWIVSLPRELTHEQNKVLAKEFIDSTMSTRYPHTWAMHDLTASDGKPQPHIHLMFSSRVMDGIDRTSEQFFRRYNAAHPEQGGAQKDPWLSDRHHVTVARQMFSDVANTHLEQAGVEERLDPRSLGSRGLPDEKTEVHLGPRPRLAAVEETLRQREAQAPKREVEARMAQEYWEARKQQLSLTPIAATWEARQPTHHAADDIARPIPLAPETEARLVQSIAQQEKRLHQIQVAAKAEEYRERTHGAESPAVAKRIAHLLDDEAPQRQPRLTPDLEQRLAHRQGMGWER